MTSDSQSSITDEARRTHRLQSRHVMADVAVLLILSLAAVGSAFTTRVGRASICGDSLQYIAAAEALLDPDDTPHFEMRKPGYPLFLAGVKLAFGQLGWAAIVGNHLLMIFLPMAAYGLGRHLRSRLLGWTAAILTMVQLQSVPFPNWMMAEAIYTFLLSVGVVLFVAGLLRSRAAFWLAAAGLTLGLAWLTKGAATAIIPVALIAIVVAHRRNPRRAALLCVACAAPVVGVVLFECSLNHAFAGRFRPSNGTAGSCMWAFRMRAFQGAGIPDTLDGDRLSDLLPERGRDQGSVGNYQDQWVSRYRAIREEGWDDWDFDDLCRRVALASIQSDPGAFARASARLTLRHLLRQGGGMNVSTVPESSREERLRHPTQPATDESAILRYAYWHLPHLELDQSRELAARTSAAARQRAPFGVTGLWSAVRYWKTKPIVISMLDVLTRLGNLWPGFALLLCPWLRLNRAACYVLAAMYFSDAILLSGVTVTEQRYHAVWMVADTTLAAAVPTVMLAGLFHRVRSFSRRADQMSCGVGVLE